MSKLTPIARHRKAVRRKINDCLYYRMYAEQFCCTFRKHRARQMRQAAKEYGLKPSVYIREAAVAFTEKRQLLPASIEQQLEDIRVMEAQTITVLMSIDERLSTSQRSFIFDPMEAKKKLEKLINRLESFIRNPSSLDDRQVYDQKSR